MIHMATACTMQLNCPLKCKRDGVGLETHRFAVHRTGGGRAWTAAKWNQARGAARRGARAGRRPSSATAPPFASDRRGGVACAAAGAGDRGVGGPYWIPVVPGWLRAGRRGAQRAMPSHPLPARVPACGALGREV